MGDGEERSLSPYLAVVAWRTCWTLDRLGKRQISRLVHASPARDVSGTVFTSITEWSSLVSSAMETGDTISCMYVTHILD